VIPAVIHEEKVSMQRTMGVHWGLRAALYASLRWALVVGVTIPAGCEWLAAPVNHGDMEIRAEAEADAGPMEGVVTERVGTATQRPTLSRVGWYEPPAGATTVVRAPATGFMAARGDERWPAIGDRVEAGTSPLQVGVFLSPQELAQLVHLKEDTDTQLQQSLVTMQLTEEQLKQVSAARDAISGARVDQIRQAYEHARAAYNDAKEKLPYLLLENADTGVALRPVAIDSPRRGIVTEVASSPGQFVVAGDPLYTVADWSTLWVRVPVFEGDLGTIDDAQMAQATDRVTGDLVDARPLRLPTEARGGGRAFDLWYAVDNAAGTLQPGRTAIVSLPLQGGKEEPVIVIRRSAVLYDGFGQASCFVKHKGEGVPFERRKVELAHTSGDRVIVRHGLEMDDEIVVEGAEQLAGAAATQILSAGDDD